LRDFEKYHAFDRQMALRHGLPTALVGEGPMVEQVEGEQYVEKIDVRLTPSQKRLIERAAKRVGLTASSWARMVILDKLGWQPPDDDEG
jgi:hypothetical protein